jgi:altronate hydrolase
MRDYAGKAEAVGSAFAFNPSPGNIKDGLITDAIKSAGAAKKGGNAFISDVLNYTERATDSGLQLVCTPGNDVEATTDKLQQEQILSFSQPVWEHQQETRFVRLPKLATNTALANRMPDVIDF